MKRALTLSLLLSSLCPISKAQPCSDLYISEYVEGSSFNKVIEIYNPTTGTVQMDGYQLLLFSNGTDTASFKFKLHGPLGSHQVYVIAHPQADSLLVLPLADTTDLVCNWNGNDAVALVNNNVGDTIDNIGVVGEDPGTEWDVSGGGTTKDHSLVRTIETQEGTTDWAVGSQQWNSFDQNDFSHLGSHTINSCPVANPEIAISVDEAVVPENIGSFTVKINILNPNSAATSGDVKVSGGTATQDDDYFFTNQTVTFPANNGDPVLLTLEVVSDGISEPDESIEISLQNATNGATIGASVVVVKIIDDDGLSIVTPVNPSVSVYPNPVMDVLHIESPNLINEIHLENILGREVMQLFSTGREQIALNLKEIPAGIYFLKIYSGNSIEVREVVKK
ncbi:MAG: lamin tail domain-containing protein [Chitinophagales bacterium]